MINQGVFDRHEINLAPGKSQPIETSDFRVEFMIVSVNQGILDLFFGANSLSGNPIRFRANDPPIWLPIALCGDKFTVSVTGSDPGNLNTLANIIFVSGSRGHFNG